MHATIALCDLLNYAHANLRMIRRICIDVEEEDDHRVYPDALRIFIHNVDDILNIDTFHMNFLLT